MPGTVYKSLEFEAEDGLSARDFKRVSELVGTKVGIKLPDVKRTLVEGRLRKRMRAVGFDKLSDYCKWMFDLEGLDQELAHLIDVVTTNKTDFFREPDHYDSLERLIIPDLLQRREPNPRIKIWSAACSNGAEAYSAAMVLEDMVRQRRSFRYAVLGTDVSGTVLKQARRAVYSSEWMEPVPTEMRARYVMQARKPGQRPEVRIAPEIRRQVALRHLNLIDRSYPIDRDVDVIFLRNVLIYFEKPVQELVITKLLGHLRTGGYLILGHSESMIGNSFDLKQIAPATFHKL